MYEFGPFRYDADQRLLFRQGELVALPPKVLETLHVLLEHRGRIVDKSELMQLVWPETHVEEVGLARNISQLRKALGDDTEETSFIETIPRRGYRFVGQTQIVASQPEPSPPAGGVKRWKWLIIPVGVLAAGAFIYHQFYVPSRFVRATGASASLAVVPFECLCAGMNGEAFSSGLNEVLVADVAKLNDVQVISPSTVRRHQRVGVSMGLMGRLLGLDVLVEGSIQKQNDQLRINARLVDVHTGKVIWADTYDHPAADPSLAQAMAARAVTQEIAKHLASKR